MVPLIFPNNPLILLPILENNFLKAPPSFPNISLILPANLTINGHAQLSPDIKVSNNPPPAFSPCFEDAAPAIDVNPFSDFGLDVLVPNFVSFSLFLCSSKKEVTNIEDNSLALFFSLPVRLEGVFEASLLTFFDAKELSPELVAILLTRSFCFWKSLINSVIASTLLFNHYSKNK